MLRSVRAAILSTAIIAAPAAAHAAPVVAVAAAVTATVSSAFTAVGAVFGLSPAAAAAFGTFGTKLALGLGLNLLAGFLTPAPAELKPSARMVNFAQPISYFETMYGRTRKGGPIGFTGYEGKHRYYLPILAAHQTEGPVQHYLDERAVDIDGAGNVTTPPIVNIGNIAPYTGQAGQVADPILVSAFPEWTASHDMAGLTYARIRARKPRPKRFAEKYPRGREWIYAPVWDGKNDIFDPRTQTYGYTNNAALVIADWAVNTLGREVDWDEVAFEAGICDQPVTLKQGGTQPRWTLNGYFSDNEEDDVVRSKMAVACDAYIYERKDGKFGFRVGRYYEPATVLTEDDFFSITVSEGQSSVDAANEVVVNYTEPDNAWREWPIGVVKLPTTERRIRDEKDLFFIDSHNQAFRVATRLLAAQNAKYKVSGVVKYRPDGIIGERFVRIRHGEFGVDEVIEVNKLTRGEDGLTFEIEGYTVQESDFEPDPQAEPDRPALGSVAEIPDNDDPTNITAQANATTGIPRLLVTWTSADFTNAHVVRWAPKGTNNWEYSPRISPDESAYLTGGVNDGQDYDVQVIAVSSVYGAELSEYLPVPAVVASSVLNQTPPAGVLNFSATGGTGTIEVSWLGPNDPNYAGAKVYQNTANDFATATLIGTFYGAPNASITETITGIAPGSYFIFAESFNGSGVPAASPDGPQNVTVV